MTEPRWPTQLQAQLVATANGVDRANRPTLFLVLPAIGLAAALVVLLPIWSQFHSAREDVKKQQRTLFTVKATSDDVKQRRLQRPDLAVLFPVNALFADNVDAAAHQVWSTTPQPPVTVGNVTPRSFLSTQTDVKKFDVSCTLNTVRLEQLMQWINQVVTSPHLSGVFVASLDLRPMPGGWSGTVVFRRYQYDPNPMGS